MYIFLKKTIDDISVSYYDNGISRYISKEDKMFHSHFPGRNRFAHEFRHGGPFGRGQFGGDHDEGGGRQRQRRGDVKFVLLELLNEQPRYGYELIKALEPGPA